MKPLPFLILSCFAFIACSKPKEKKEELPLVAITSPKVGPCPIYLDTVAHMEPIHTVKIEPQVDGQIVALYYEEGSFVESGTLLLSIDQRIYNAQKTQAEGNLIQSKAELAFAKDTMVRNRPLADLDYVSQDSFDQLVYNTENLEGLVLANMGGVDEASVKLGYTQIYAPISGVLGEKRFDVGDVAQTAENQTLVTINQIAPIWARFGISQNYLAKIQKEWKKHPITVEIYDSDPLKPLDRGNLVFIDNAVDENTGMITMKATLDNGEELLWPGAYLRARLIMYVEENGITVPVEAVLNGIDGHYLFTIDEEGVAHKKNVKTGLRQEGGKTLMITEGLKGDEKVVIQGQINIDDLSKAKITHESL